MSQSRGYQRGELFRRVHLPSVERRNQDGNQEESKGIQISSDALSEGPIEAHATSLPRDQSITQSKRKASDVSANENHAAKKTKKSPKIRPPFCVFTCLATTLYCQGSSTRDPGVIRLHVNASLFFDHGWAGYLTYPGPPPPC